MQREIVHIWLARTGATVTAIVGVLTFLWCGIFAGTICLHPQILAQPNGQGRLLLVIIGMIGVSAIGTWQLLSKGKAVLFIRLFLWVNVLPFLAGITVRLVLC